MPLIAIDVAILPPPPIRDRALDLNARLSPAGSKGLVLDESHLPHITLTQQFVRSAELEPVMEAINRVVREQSPLSLHVTGGAKGGRSVWIAIERSPTLVHLHEQLMEALREFEKSDAGPAAFYGADARVQDRLWVKRYRANASYGSFTPHITLGHAAQPPEVEPRAFAADTIAVCHLGRFCSCRQVLRTWRLSHEDPKTK